MKKHFDIYATAPSREVFSMPSRKMIKTLKDCLDLETRFPGRSYGPADISGSFLGLYKRGFLDISLGNKKKSRPGSWYVTTKGLHFLISLSVKKPGADESQVLSNMFKLQKNVTSLHDSMYNFKKLADQIINK